MKIRLQGTPDELREKGPTLIKALAARLGVSIESLLDPVDLLEKAEATKKPEPSSHYGAIRDLAKMSGAVYKEEMALMLKEINEVLDQGEA
jgi:DNA-binding Lrp family transcriptional regulator